MRLCVERFLAAVPLQLSAEKDKATVSRIANGDGAIDPQLHSEYADSLRRAVDAVPMPDNPDLAARLQANAARFAAYKAARATSDIREAEKSKEGDGLKALNAQRRFLAAEANTATARARTAKQWDQFNDDKHLELFPNLEWLPSRSATRREAHVPFYHLVLPKNHQFWQDNQPGNLWNCKCDWQETDSIPHIPKDERTGKTPDVDNAKTAARGMEGNPGVTGEIFSPKAAYFKAPTRSEKNKIEKWIGDKLARPKTIQAFNNMNVRNVVVETEHEGTLSVVFDGKSKSHISNDAAVSSDLLIAEIAPRLPDILQKSKLVAHEDNAKPKEKPSAVQYLYFEYRMGNKVYYLNVEENFVVMENRHFYRLYSVTKKLRKTVKKYNIE